MLKCWFQILLENISLNHGYQLVLGEGREMMKQMFLQLPLNPSCCSQPASVTSETANTAEINTAKSIGGL